MKPDASSRVIDENVELLPGASILLEAFYELQTDRALGFGGYGPIPTTSIAAYADRIGMGEPDEMALLRRAVRVMEREWQDCQPKKEEG